jgi:hypothetical protein
MEKGEHTMSQCRELNQNDQDTREICESRIAEIEDIAKCEKTEKHYYEQATAYTELCHISIRINDFQLALDNIDLARIKLVKAISKLNEDSLTRQHYDILLFCDVVKWAVLLLKKKQTDCFKLLSPEEVTLNLATEMEVKLGIYNKLRAGHCEDESDSLLSSSVSSNMNAMFNRNFQKDFSHQEQTKYAKKRG